jgi:hypothetical protein
MVYGSATPLRIADLASVHGILRAELPLQAFFCDGTVCIESPSASGTGFNRASFKYTANTCCPLGLSRITYFAL